MVPFLATSCGKEHCMCDNSRNGCEHGEADCMRSGVKKKKVLHVHFINRVNTLFFV